MNEDDFKWLFKEADDSSTKSFLKDLEKGILYIHKRPLSLGRQKIWTNNENQSKSLQTYIEIFRYRDHTELPGFLSKKDKVILDIGANEGFFTLRAKKTVPYARLISFEPNPHAFKLLKRNILSNKLRNVTAVNKAVTSRGGRISFEIVKGRTTVGATKVYRKYREEGKLRKITVNSITLRSILQRYRINKVDFLKIDAEGSEFDILRSSRSVLPKVRKIVVEYHSAQKTKDNVRRFLEANGFRMLLDSEKKYYGEFYFARR